MSIKTRVTKLEGMQSGVGIVLPKIMDEDDVRQVCWSIEGKAFFQVFSQERMEDRRCFETRVTEATVAAIRASHGGTAILLDPAYCPSSEFLGPRAA